MRLNKAELASAAWVSFSAVAGFVLYPKITIAVVALALTTTAVFILTSKLMEED